MDGKSRRQVRQDAPASRLPQDGQASNSASGARALMDASCRNAPAVVTVIAADYHLHMAAMHSTETFRVVDRAGGSHRLWLRSEGGDRITHIAAAGYQGPSLPEAMTNPVLHRQEGAGPRSCRLETDQGRFEFESASFERIEARPMLFAGLHRPFALSAIDRLAVRFLLMLLRLPGGAGLLRRWHASRTA
jgi:hypothetical protein